MFNPSPNQPLFLSASSEDKIPSQNEHARTLFPVADEVQEADSANENAANKAWTWLTNKSYGKDAQETFNQFYRDQTLEKESTEPSSSVAAEDAALSHEDLDEHERKIKKRRKQHSEKPVTELEQELIAQHSKKIFIEDVGLSPEHAFRIDRKSDRNNLAFNAMYHVFIARYFSRRRLLGQDSPWMADSKNKKHAKNVRYYSRQNVSKLISDDDILDYANRHLIYDKGKFREKMTYCAEYVPLEISVNELNSENSKTFDALGIYDESTKAYFLGSTQNSATEDGDKNFKDLMEVPKKETCLQCIKRRTAEFNQYLRENPSDENKWLEFLKFQDEILLNPEKLSEFGKVTEKSILEKKLSILDHALEKNSGSITLAVTKLDFCKDVWETSKLKKEWKHLTFIHPNNIFVWERYLNFLQSRFSSFSFSSVVAGYVKCFSKLIQILEGKFQSHLPPANLEARMLVLFANYCNFLRQSGYAERAIATFQALIEFNFFVPDNLTSQLELKDWLAFFEPFWDSGMPRFGEKGAFGWATVMKMKQFSDSPDEKKKGLDEKEDEIIQQKLTKQQTWLLIERLRQNHHCMPWRQGMSEDEECDDPDRMILFDDVGPFLFRLTDVNHKFKLLQTFLNFLGIYSNPHSVIYCGSEDCHHPRHIDTVSYPWVLHNHFQYKFTKTSLGLPSSFHLGDEPCNEEQLNFAQQVVQESVKLVPHPFQEDLTKLWMQHKRTQIGGLKILGEPSFKQSLKDVKKKIKFLLKEEKNRNNLQLWYEYCRLEQDFGSDVEKILDVSLQAHPHTPFNPESGIQDIVLCKFYRIFAQHEMKNDTLPSERINMIPRKSFKECKSISLLTTVGAGEIYGTEVTPSMILKARNRYQNHLNLLLNDYVHQKKSILVHGIPYCDHFLVEWSQCYSLFQYLTLGLQSATIVYEVVIEKMCQFERELGEVVRPVVKRDLEIIYLAYLWLLLHHVNTTPSSLKMLRTVLQRALAVFPDSPQMLDLLINLESGSHIAGRLRKHFTHWMKASQSPTVCLYSLLSEMWRKDNRSSLYEDSAESAHLSLIHDDGISHRISSIFEQASKIPNCVDCPLLWRLYLSFEVKRGNLKKAKSVFYQAVQSCPWVKALYLDAVKAFPDDIQEIMDIMTEKEIRIRLPIEELDLLMGLANKTDDSIEMTDVEKIKSEDSGPLQETYPISEPL